VVRRVLRRVLRLVLLSGLRDIALSVGRAAVATRS
jgi:hypothetical protein